MKLMTKELEAIFGKYPLYSQEGKGLDSKVIAKYFNPCGAGTWLITEGEKQDDGDWLLFGYIHVREWEWGYVTLSQLEDILLPYGLRIERDLYASGELVKDYI